MTDAAPPGRPRGRRPYHGTALTPAEKQRAYRERRALEAYADDDLLDKLSRVSLLQNLGTYLRLSDEAADEEARDAARWMAEKYLRVLVRRYGLKVRK